MKAKLLDASCGVFIIAVILSAIFAGVMLPPNGFAARAAPIETPSCEPIAHAGALLIFRCIDDQTGRELYVNQVGFMVLVE